MRTCFCLCFQCASVCAGGMNAESADGREREDNALVDAWQEDGNLGKHLAALHVLFGDAVQPYVPYSPVSAVLL